jgi:hypothetical protein
MIISESRILKVFKEVFLGVFLFFWIKIEKT